MGVDQCDKHAAETGHDCPDGGFAGSELLTAALKDEDIGVDTDADRQRHAGNTRQCKGDREGSDRSEKDQRYS